VLVCNQLQQMFRIGIDMARPTNLATPNLSVLVANSQTQFTRCQEKMSKL
jgi:hypothetical protein